MHLRTAIHQKLAEKIIVFICNLVLHECLRYFLIICKLNYSPFDIFSGIPNGQIQNVFHLFFAQKLEFERHLPKVSFVRGGSCWEKTINLCIYVLWVSRHFPFIPGLQLISNTKCVLVCQTYQTDFSFMQSWDFATEKIFFVNFSKAKYYNKNIISSSLL